MYWLSNEHAKLVSSKAVEYFCRILHVFSGLEVANAGISTTSAYFSTLEQLAKICIVPPRCMIITCCLTCIFLCLRLHLSI